MPIRNKPGSSGLGQIHRELERYARRGVFRSFSRAGDEFHFDWLWGLPFHLTFDRQAGALTFYKLLPEVTPGSDLARGLRAFVRGLHSPGRPPHRRIDPKRVGVRYSNRHGNVTLAFVIAGSDHQYAVRMALAAVNEILAGYLSLHHPEYMAENFRLPME